MKFVRRSLVLSLLIVPGVIWAQGQDSQPADRDLQVITTLLSGGYDNANQSYFDQRGKRDVKHRRRHQSIETVSVAGSDEPAFVIRAFWDGEPDNNAGLSVWQLAPDYTLAGVRMHVIDFASDTALAAFVGGDRAVGSPQCDLLWRREAEQFRASTVPGCTVAGGVDELVLGESQLWLSDSRVDDGNFQMHRIRNFECYADIPGVGGGRDIPYDRYDGLKIHDQGGEVWFTSKEGRRLGISLLLVDWPINNYEGIFTRDSFVIYVSEEADGERKEIGYAFTVPEADRIGINLKWMLASCFMKSNKFATPSM